MTKRRLSRWTLMLVTLAALAIWLEPTRVVWGWVCGEPFYKGRPTSFWRGVVERDLQMDRRLLEARAFGGPLPPAASWWDRGLEWFNLQTNRATSVELVTWDKESHVVLRVLADDADAKVADFAKEAMRYRLWASPHQYWYQAIRKQR